MSKNLSYLSIFRIWDVVSAEVVSSVSFESPPLDLQLNRSSNEGSQKSILSCGKSVSVWSLDGPKFEKISQFDLPCDVYSSCLHPKAFQKSDLECDEDDNTDVFVSGGKDFILYKCDANTGVELGKL